MYSCIYSDFYGILINTHIYSQQLERLRWSRGGVLAFSTQVRGLKLGQSRRIFQGTPSFKGK
jgi:hypothetical protein